MVESDRVTEEEKDRGREKGRDGGEKQKERKRD